MNSNSRELIQDTLKSTNIKPTLTPNQNYNLKLQPKKTTQNPYNKKICNLQNKPKMKGKNTI